MMYDIIIYIIATKPRTCWKSTHI